MPFIIGHAIKLKPRTFDVLSFLVERAGRLVTRSREGYGGWTHLLIGMQLRRARKEPHEFAALVEPHGPGKTRLSED